MSEIQKALWSRDGSQVALSFEMQKIADKNERIVIGFATLDNLDLTNDIVTAEASLRAFNQFRGNVRVQHDKSKPVGRVISFEPATYYDENTQKSYSGIRVAVRVSDGAEDVWKMCLDGTLNGFSIGGAIIKASDIYREDIGRKVKVIEEYALTELSLVDSPANHLANVQIVKSLDGAIDEIQKDFDSYTLFWCGTDRIAAKSTDRVHACIECGENMAPMGSMERNEDIKTQLDKVLSELKIDMEGGQPQVADKKNKETIEKSADNVEEVISKSEEAPAEETQETETVAEEATTEEAPAEEEKAEETEDAPAEEAAEEETETTDANSDIRDLLEALSRRLEESADQVAKDSEGIRAEVAEISKSLNSKFEELEERQKAFERAQDELKEKINSTTDGLEQTQKRLDNISESTAMQKSHSVVTNESAERRASKSKFAGLFSGDYDA